jgi:hypothetical protein
MEEVPEEMELKLLALLPWADLARAALVCSRWHRLCIHTSPYMFCLHVLRGDTHHTYAHSQGRKPVGARVRP